MHFAIVSYTFPPSKEIGGRRWAKFSLELSRQGHEVTVICSKEKNEVNWHDEEFSAIKRIVLPKYYPSWLSGVTNSITQKLLYAFFTKIISPFTKHNLFDKGLLWRRPMLRTLEGLHDSKPIDFLVVSGGPFSLISFGAEFKLKYPNVSYVIDLRDPWTWGILYGIPAMGSRKKLLQEKLEKNAISVCDMFCFPVDEMGTYLIQKYPQFRNKFYLLPHAYDPTKFHLGKSAKKRSGFIYGGTLYSDIDVTIRKLAAIVAKHPTTNFKWDIYTGSSYSLIETLFESNKVTVHKLLPEEELFEKIANAAAYLVFFPTSAKDLISTKFFEIINCKTPILFIGEEGTVSKFIKDNRLGVHVSPENMEKDLPKYLEGEVPFEEGFFDVSKYSFPRVTEVFLEALYKLRV